MNLTNYEKTIKELIFWKSNIKFLNKKPLRVYDLSKTVIFLDASSCAMWAIFENESGTQSNNERMLRVINLEKIISDKIHVKIFCSFITKHFNTFKNW